MWARTSAEKFSGGKEAMKKDQKLVTKYRKIALFSLSQGGGEGATEKKAEKYHF